MFNFIGHFHFYDNRLGRGLSSLLCPGVHIAVKTALLIGGHVLWVDIFERTYLPGGHVLLEDMSYTGHVIWVDVLFESMFYQRTCLMGGHVLWENVNMSCRRRSVIQEDTV